MTAAEAQWQKRSRSTTAEPQPVAVALRTLATVDRSVLYGLITKDMGF
jgi:hypothetical protein